MSSEVDLLALLAQYRAAMSKYLHYHMEHRLTALHLQRKGHWGPAEACAYHGRWKSLIKFEECFGKVEPDYFADLHRSVEQEMRTRDETNVVREAEERQGDPDGIAG
jgi:hypothetical protein